MKKAELKPLLSVKYGWDVKTLSKYTVGDLREALETGKLPIISKSNNTKKKVETPKKVKKTKPEKQEPKEQEPKETKETKETKEQETKEQETKETKEQETKEVDEKKETEEVDEKKETEEVDILGMFDMSDSDPDMSGFEDDSDDGGWDSE